MQRWYLDHRNGLWYHEQGSRKISDHLGISQCISVSMCAWNSFSISFVSVLKRHHVEKGKKRWFKMEPVICFAEVLAVVKAEETRLQ